MFFLTTLHRSENRKTRQQSCGGSCHCQTIWCVTAGLQQGRRTLVSLNARSKMDSLRQWGSLKRKRANIQTTLETQRYSTVYSPWGGSESHVRSRFSLENLVPSRPFSAFITTQGKKSPSHWPATLVTFALLFLFQVLDFIFTYAKDDLCNSTHVTMASLSGTVSFLSLAPRERKGTWWVCKDPEL